MEIEKLLQANRKSLKDYPSMPYPKGYVSSQLGNRLIYEERDYDTSELQSQFQQCFNSLTGKTILILLDSLYIVTNQVSQYHALTKH